MASHWDLLLDAASLASVLPREYSHFARPIRDGLTVFLNHLAAEDQAEILRSQAALPATATLSQRLRLLAQSCPVLQKLGQILARDQRLAPELREQLRQLESLPPSVPLESIKRTLQRELGTLETRGVTLRPPAIAEASVAVVIPFQESTPRRRGGRPMEGVFKILKPGIEDRLEQELTLLDRVGAHLDDRCEELQIPHLDYQASFQQVREKLSEEVRLEHEQRHLAQARELFADEPQVQIPELLPHCSSRVTAMERIGGGKVTSHGAGSPRQRRRLAALVAKALLAKPVFSRSPHALFHCDPHAGNLFFTDDGRLAILDWSLVGRLGEQERVAIVQIMLGACALDAGRIVSELRRLADRQRLDDAALDAVVRRWLRRIRRGQLPGLSGLIGMLDEATQTARLRVGADLMLFRKSLLTLEGVIAEVGGSSCQIDKVLFHEFLRHFAAEWPQRWLRLPHSRDFATRLSNVDLTRTMLGCPAAAARFWMDHSLDLLEAGVGRCQPSRVPETAP